MKVKKRNTDIPTSGALKGDSLDDNKLDNTQETVPLEPEESTGKLRVDSHGEQTLGQLK